MPRRANPRMVSTAEIRSSEGTGAMTGGMSCRSAMALTLGNCRLPEFNAVSFGVLQPRKAPVGVHLGINLDFNIRGTKLRGDRIKVCNAKIQHPGVLCRPNVLGAH